ncbi:MAG: hypothetical protein H7250_11620 [Flavobacterium sp.]|nr:hypothetical protein [Flavobacterium sp.]
MIEKAVVLENISDLIQKQIVKIKMTDTNAKNCKLYFSLLLKTNDVIKSTIDLL